MADVIFLGGDVITVNDAQPTAEAVAVKDGKILAVGSVADVSKHSTPNTRTVDLQGKTLMPGLVEPHSHPSLASRIYNELTYIGTSTHTTLDDVYSTMEEMVKTRAPGEWLLFSGYDAVNQTRKDIPRPLLTKLDQISSVHPIVIVPTHLHNLHCNSLALQLAGITKETVVVNGEIKKDENGELTGELSEPGAFQPVLDAIPSEKKEKYLGDFRIQANSYSKQGVTTVAEMGVGLFLPVLGDSHFLEDLQAETSFSVRYVTYLNRLDHNSKIKDKCFEPPILNPTENYSQIGVKLWADGSPHCCTMAVEEPYLDSKLIQDTLFVKYPCFGEINLPFSKFLDLVRGPAKQGHQIAFHTHGERAIDQTLDVYEALLKEVPKMDHRYRLEHCGLIKENQLQRCKDLGVTVTFYLDHIYFKGQQLSESFLGEERVSRWAPVTLAQKHNVRWSLHQDTPCVPCKPFLGMRTAVTRLTQETPDNPERVLGPEYCISVEEAIKGWTIYPAWQLFHEDVIGSIEVGKLADLIVIDKNPYKVEPRDLHTIKVMNTYRNGQQVYAC